MRSTKPLLRPVNFGHPMLDAFELQEKLIGIAVRPAAELTAVVREVGRDPRVVGLEVRQHATEVKL